MFVELAMIVVLLLATWHATRKPFHYPPGLWGLPLIGYIPIFEKRKPIQVLEDLNKKYGNIVSWRIGTRMLVSVSDFGLLKEAFQGQDFVDRADLLTAFSLITSDNQGITTSKGPHWETIRRFSLRHLRNFGMGKSKLVMAIQSEAMQLVEVLRKQTGVVKTLPHGLTASLLNVIWQMVASQRYDLEDKELEDFDNSIRGLEGNYTRFAAPCVFPWMKYVVPSQILNMMTREKDRESLATKLKSVIQKSITEHQKDLDCENPRDYVDAYLIEMEKRKDDPASTMSIEDLIVCASDLFFAGSETTTATLKWAIFYLASNPRVQKAIQKEVDEVLPKGTLATLEDRPRLPYTEATIYEVIRMTSLGSLGGMHQATNETQLGGYTIPKGTLVVAALTLLHVDPKLPATTREFRPERFLDSDGSFTSHKDWFLPFGVGRRQCLGESLARMELLIFLSTLVQNFHFAPPPSEELNLTPRENLFLNLVREDPLFITAR